MSLNRNSRSGKLSTIQFFFLSQNLHDFGRQLAVGSNHLTGQTEGSHVCKGAINLNVLRWRSLNFRSSLKLNIKFGLMMCTLGTITYPTYEREENGLRCMSENHRSLQDHPTQTGCTYIYIHVYTGSSSSNWYVWTVWTYININPRRNSPVCCFRVLGFLKKHRPYIMILLMAKILHQLRLVVSPIIYDGFYTSQVVVWDFFHQLLI